MDIFICHTSDDKASVVHPLVDSLPNKIKCWVDEAEILWGDSITGKVNQGLRESHYVIVVLSKKFLESNWPKLELDAMLNLEATSGVSKVLPLLCGTEEECADILEAYPLLNHKLHMRWPEDTKILLEHIEKLATRNDVAPNVPERSSGEDLRNFSHIEQESTRLVPSFKEKDALFIPIIMAGGLGTRVIHLSPSKIPKILWRIYGRESMFQDTIRRLNVFSVGFSTHPPIVLSVDKFRRQINSQIDEVTMIMQGDSNENFPKQLSIERWFEPDRKGTAAAIMYGVLKAEMEGIADDDTVLGFFPADQHIFLDDSNQEDQEKATELFNLDLQHAIHAASKGNSLLLIGTKVIFNKEEIAVASRYGLIEAFVPSSSISAVKPCEIQLFHEKPTPEYVQKCLHKMETHSYFFNSGVFVASLGCFKLVLETLLGDWWIDMHQAMRSRNENELQNCYNRINDEKETRLFDRAIVQKLASENYPVEVNLLVKLANYKWEDLGHPDSIRNHYLRRKWIWSEVGDDEIITKKELLRKFPDWRIDLKPSGIEEIDATYIVFQPAQSNRLEVLKLKPEADDDA